MSGKVGEGACADMFDESDCADGCVAQVPRCALRSATRRCAQQAVVQRFGNQEGMRGVQEG